MRYATAMICALLLGAPAFAKTFTVNSTIDAVANNPASGVCETAPGNGVCTLRAAIQVANASVGADTIILPAGTYTLTIPGLAEDAAASGDLDITDDLTISGAGAATTIIQGCAPTGGATTCTGLDRVFHVDPTGKLISATISGVTIQNGTTTLISFVSSNGGAILLGVPQTLGNPVPSGRLTLVDCVVRNSQTPRDGGGIAVNAGTLILINTTVSGNSGGNGGGLALGDFSKTTMSGSTVSNNLGSQGGGIFMGYFDISIGGTQLAITNSTISNNQSGTAGGIFRNRGAFVVTNSTISGNTSGNSGGGIFDSGTNNGPDFLNNVTITKNSVPTFGGGISGGGGHLTIQNSIIAENTGVPGNFGGGPDCNASIISGGHNLVENTTGCTISGDTATIITGRAPLLGVLANYGGPTQTHALLSGSPAIGTGSSLVPGSGGTACASTDQRGVLRPQPEGGICDIGAFEFHGGLAITGMLPDHTAGTGQVLAMLFGDSFVPGATVKLNCAGTEIPGGPITVDATSSVVTTVFDLTGMAPTLCDVVLTNSNGTSATKSGALTIENPVAPQLWAQLAARDAIRVGRPARIHVLYGNLGNTDELGVALGISLTRNLAVNANFQVAPPPAQPGDPSTDWSKVTVGVVSKRPGRTFVPLFVPVVPAGFTGVFEFTVTPPVADHGQPYSIEASIGPATVSESLTPDPQMLTGMVSGAKAYAQQFMHTTIPASKDAQISQYLTKVLQDAILAGRNKWLASQGAAPLYYSYGQLLIGGAANGSGQPGPAPGAGGAGDGGGGDAGADPGDDPPDCDELGWCDEPPSPPPCDKWPPTACGGVAPGGGPLVDSLDPNDKVGPIGIAASRFILDDKPLGYAVFFENQATATAPAQRVVITDRLDPAKVDLNTFSFGPAEFGTQIFSPAPGLSTFIHDVDLRPAQKIIARVVGRLDKLTGLVTWTFSSIDPFTLEETTDPLAGFLPPNTTSPAGEGSVMFNVFATEPIATGTAICNQATVVFDTNPAINTPTWCNTIDTVAPRSLVTALPASESQATFNVAWSGTDAGSGIHDYTIYVSDNGGPFTAFQTNTPATSATFSGQVGHTYGFYSIARDLVGNVEASKTTAEATTQVGGGGGSDTTPPVIIPQVSGTLGSNGWYTSNVSVSWNVVDPESGITSSSGCTPTALTADTAGATLTCSATNGVGLSASIPVTVKIDKNPPRIYGMPSAGCTLSPPNKALVQVATVSALDSLSGIGPGSFTLNATSSEPSDPANPDVVITKYGSQKIAVQLRADRLDAGTGRTYTLNATVTDLAGNSTTATATCIVPH